MRLTEDGAAPGNRVEQRRTSGQAGWRLILLIAVVASHLAFAWFARSPGILTGQDDAEYVLLARAVGDGSYRELWRRDAPIHSQYPPGYPAMLAAWGAVWGTSHDALVTLSMVASAASLLLLYAGLSRRLAADVALASVAVLAANPFFIDYAGAIVSESAYIFWSVACLYLLIRSSDATAQGQRSTMWLTAAAAAAIIAAQTRTIGIALLGAVWLWMMIERRWRAALAFGVSAAATSGAWLAWTVLAPEQFTGRSYVADVAQAESGGFWVTQVLPRIGSNAWGYGTAGLPYSTAFPTVEGTPIDNVVALVILWVTILAGLYVLARRWRDGGLYLLAYVSVLLVFPYRLTRFLIPILVLLIPAAFAGAEVLARRLRPAWSKGALAALALVLVSGGIARSTELVPAPGCQRTGGIPSEGCMTAEQVGYFAALRFIQGNLPESATLLTFKSGALYYYTGRTTITVEGAREQHPDDFIDFVRGQGADYVLLASVDNNEWRHYAPPMHADCRRVQLVKAFDARTLLLALNPDAQLPSADGDACEAIAEYRAANSDETP